MLISIIMPVYNNDKGILTSIKSVLYQTYSYWELLVIDDASSVDIKKCLQQNFHDERINYFRLAKNSGVAAARNKGMELANGRYVAFLDSDDIWLPEKLAKQVAFMREKNAAVSCTQYRRFRDDVSNVGKVIDVKSQITYHDLLKGNSMGCLTVMIDREKVSSFAMPSVRHEDYVTWLNIAKEGYIIYGLREDLARYRVSSTSLSGNKLKSFMWTWNVYRQSQGISVIKSLYYILCYIVQACVKRI